MPDAVGCEPTDAREVARLCGLMAETVRLQRQFSGTVRAIAALPVFDVVERQRLTRLAAQQGARWLATADRLRQVLGREQEPQ